MNRIEKLEKENKDMADEITQGFQEASESMSEVARRLNLRALVKPISKVLYVLVVMPILLVVDLFCEAWDEEK